jgi:hypothetical protein
MSGKDRIARLLNEDGTRVHTMEPYDTEAVEPAYQDLIKEGFSPLVYFVETTNEISKMRNEARASRGQRVLNEGVRFEKFTKAQESKARLSELFGSNFHVLDNSIQEGKNDVTVKVKVEQPKAAAKKKPSGSSTTKTMKNGKKKVVKKSAEQVKMDMEAQKQRYAVANEKNKQKFTQDSEERKLAHERDTQEREAKGVHFQTRAAEMEMRMQQIRDTMSRLQPQGTNYKKIHSLMRKQMAGAQLGQRKFQSQALKSQVPPKEPAKPSVNEAFEQMLNEHAGEWGTNELRQNYQDDTPGQTTILDLTNQPTGDGISSDAPGAIAISGLPEWPGQKVGLGGLAEHIQTWATSPTVIQRFKDRYGDFYAHKIMETARFMNEQKLETKPKSVSKLKESIDKGIGAMGTVPMTNGKGEELEEGSVKPKTKKRINRRKPS